MAGTKFIISNSSGSIELVTKGDVVIDQIGAGGFISMTFLDSEDMKKYWEADMALNREFTVTLVELGGNLRVNPVNLIGTLPWVMEKLIGVGG